MSGSGHFMPDWEKKHHERELEQAMIVGGGTSTAHGPYSSAVDVVAKKLNAQYEWERGENLNTPEPSTHGRRADRSPQEIS
ncbi:MAG TPA: hypothetical protein PK271_04770 [Hyphomicrobium sp.]|uniref:hypothetical protein n=1 Tax=Hyphomicrobium sp. TaxID=82 RepID=UPI002CDB6D25|nr:hypothetical protein [Hyphomicrobium sp.]HRN87894.1 hypothetical protein [Hyphomicrobium sp.]